MLSNNYKISFNKIKNQIIRQILYWISPYLIIKTKKKWDQEIPKIVDCMIMIKEVQLIRIS